MMMGYSDDGNNKLLCTMTVSEALVNVFGGAGKGWEDTAVQVNVL